MSDSNRIGSSAEGKPGGSGELLARIEAELGHRVPRGAPAGTYERQAAVALILRPGSEGLDFLAIRRARMDRDPWSGHMALPGGRREPGDEDLWRTAMRETREEVRLDLGRLGRRLGRLDDVLPASPRLPSIAIRPFVAAVAPEANAGRSSEVQRALWVPVGVLIGEEHRGVLRLEEADGREFPTLEWEGEIIWGLTFSILLQFADVLRRIGYPDETGAR